MLGFSNMILHGEITSQNLKFILIISVLALFQLTNTDSCYITYLMCFSWEEISDTEKLGIPTYI